MKQMKSVIGKHLWIAVLTVMLICGALIGGSAESTGIIIEATGSYVSEENGLSNEAAANGYVNKAFYGEERRRGSTAGNQLQGKNVWLYTALKQEVTKIANGQESSAIFDFPLNEVFDDVRYDAAALGLNDLSDNDAVGSAFIGKLFSLISPALDALRYDCPYELYWFDKTSGIMMGTSYVVDNGTVRFPNYENGSVSLLYSVATAYAGTEQFSVNPTTGATVQTAVKNAQDILDRYASRLDYYKLKAFKDEICSLTGYNTEAAANDNTPYGDPWQMVYVFDGNPATTVVCEGYSKAFQYLCDLSSFSSASCITVSGTMTGGTGAGNHMWNIVTLGEKNYIADITNSDAGTIGAGGALFLTGASYGNEAEGYAFSISTQTITYRYDEETTATFGATGRLKLVGDNYELSECEHVFDKNGYCPLCGYQCQHEGISSIEWAMTELQGPFYLIESETEHVVYATKTAFIRQCPICAYYEQDWSIPETYPEPTGREPHTYHNGFCDCGAVCPHTGAEETTMLTRTMDDPIWFAVDEKDHVYTRVTETYHICPICNGEVIVNRSIAADVDPAALEQKTHIFNTSGYCDLCGYVCPHSLFTNNVCDNCGFVCPHQVYVHGFCDVCGYECPHANPEITQTTTETEWEWASSTQHRELIITTTSYYCPVCGDSLDPVQTITENLQNHQDPDEDGICNICQQKIEGSFSYEFSAGSGVLRITGNGTIPDYEQVSNLPWYEHLGSIQRVIIEGDFTSIGKNALAGLGNLTAGKPVRIDFRQRKMPEIEDDTFTGTQAVCRYYSTDNSWGASADRTNGDIQWVYLPAFNPDYTVMQRITYDSNPSYTGWTVESYRVNALQAYEITYEYRIVELMTLPSDPAELKVITDHWDTTWQVIFGADCSGEVNWTVSADAYFGLCFEVHAENLELNVDGMLVNSINRILIDGGEMNYTGNARTLYLYKNSSGHSEPNLTVTGQAEVLHFYDASSSNAYTGSLTVHGKVLSGTVYGKTTISIPNISEEVVFEDVVRATFTDVEQENPIILNGVLNVTGVVPVENVTYQDYILQYHLMADGWRLGLVPRDNSGKTYAAYIDDVEQYNPNFTTDDIIWSDETQVYVSDVTNLGTLKFDGGENGEGLGLLSLSKCTVEVNCPVSSLGVDQLYTDTLPTTVSINNAVNSLYLIIRNTGSRITLGANGSVESGWLSRYQDDYRYFGKVTDGDLYAEDRLQVMSWKQGQTISALLPSNSEVMGKIEGLPAGQTAMADVDQVDMDDLLDEEQQVLDSFLAENGGSAVGVFDATITTYATDAEGNLIKTGETAELTGGGVGFTVSNSAGKDGYVVRLHDEENVMTATILEDTDDSDDTLTFTSNLFSKYVIINPVTVPDAWGWEYEAGERMIRITGAGRVLLTGPAPWLGWGYHIDRVMIDEGITEIGANVFAGLQGRVRIDFRQEKMPVIAADAFGSTKAVCRYTSMDASWDSHPAATQNITWAWMPTFNYQGAGTFGPLWYAKDEATPGWSVEVMEDHQLYDNMSAETAHEILRYSCDDLILNAVPDNLFDVIGDAETDSWYLTVAGGCTGELKLDNDNCTVLPCTVNMCSAGTTLNITDTGETGIRELIVKDGTVSYTGKVQKLALKESGEQSFATVSINGTINELAYYNAETPFRGKLTVTGSLTKGYIYGDGSVPMAIPGVTDAYPMFGCASTTIGPINNLTNDILIDTSSEGTPEDPVVKAELNGGITPTIDMFRLRYALDGVYNMLFMDPLTSAGIGSERVEINIDAYNTKFMNDLTNNIIWGDSTELYLSMADNSQTITLEGKDGKGLVQLEASGKTTAVVNCPVGSLDIQPDPMTFGNINLTFTDTISSAYLQPNNCELNITLSNGGSIAGGRLKQLLRDYREFGPHSAGSGKTLDLVKNGALTVLSWKDGEALKAILPSDASVGEAAGAKAMATLKEMNGLTDSETAALASVTDGNETLAVAEDQIISIFDVSVTKYSVDASGVALEGDPVHQLQREIPVTVSTNSEATDIFVVRLHSEGDGSLSATKLTVTDSAGGKQFTSDSFSTYLLVNAHDPSIPVMGTPTFVTPSGLQTIEADALAGIAAEVVRITDGVTTIGDRAFAGSGVKQVIIENAGTVISDTAFTGCSDLIVFGVPGGAVQVWASANNYAFYPIQ